MLCACAHSIDANWQKKSWREESEDTRTKRNEYKFRAMAQRREPLWFCRHRRNACDRNQINYSEITRLASRRRRGRHFKIDKGLILISKSFDLFDIRLLCYRYHYIMNSSQASDECILLSSFAFRSSFFFRLSVGRNESLVQRKQKRVASGEMVMINLSLANTQQFLLLLPPPRHFIFACFALAVFASSKSQNEQKKKLSFFD